MKKFFYIYKITDTRNGKIYIGAHIADNLDDGYMGSGYILKKLYKRRNMNEFKKEIIEFLPDRESLFKREAEIVNEDFLKRNDVYNLVLGGSGGSIANNERRKLSLSLYRRNKVNAIDLISGQNILISKEEFDRNEERYVGKTKGKCVVKDLSGKIKMITQEEFYNNRNYYVGSTKGFISVKDKSGNTFSVSKDDPRLKDGTLVGVTKGCTQTPESNLKRNLTTKGRRPEQILRHVTCEYCGKDMNIGNYIRWHKDGSCNIRNKR